MVRIPPWRSLLSRALHRNRALPYANYFQLATVREDGTPANRTVVFRRFLGDDPVQIVMVTDQRSEKIQHIAQQPWGEACWYFPKTREQFRLMGPLTLITSDCTDEYFLHARRSLWQSLSDKSRSQFSWPFPGHPRASHEAFQSESSLRDRPVESFCLLLLAPRRVDHLELRGDPQNRYIYELNDAQEWSVREVNP